jgi:hypothetical protein
VQEQRSAGQGGHVAGQPLRHHSVSVRHAEPSAALDDQHLRQQPRQQLRDRAFSAHARITDNYIVFQVRIDGVPMQGHLSAIGPYTTPAIVALYDDPSEQLSDPTKVVAYNFFARVGPGTHTVQVMVAAGSGIDPNNLPQVGSPVLTLQHR